MMRNLRRLKTTNALQYLNKYGKYILSIVFEGEEDKTKFFNINIAIHIQNKGIFGFTWCEPTDYHTHFVVTKGNLLSNYCRTKLKNLK